jgi:hypothetical protein
MDPIELTMGEWPCNFDHNGECLICDCWSTECAYQRYLNQDYKWETKEELENMFKIKNDDKI